MTNTPLCVKLLVYDYMDWPEIEAVVYGEETAPRDVMGPRLTPDGVLIQGFFPEARAAAVVIGRKKYEMELEDEAGYYAVLIPGRKALSSSSVRSPPKA